MKEIILAALYISVLLFGVWGTSNLLWFSFEYLRTSFKNEPLPPPRHEMPLPPCPEGKVCSLSDRLCENPELLDLEGYAPSFMCDPARMTTSSEPSAARKVMLIRPSQGKAGLPRSDTTPIRHCSFSGLRDDRKPDSVAPFVPAGMTIISGPCVLSLSVSRNMVPGVGLALAAPILALISSTSLRNSPKPFEPSQLSS